LIICKNKLNKIAAAGKVPVAGTGDIIMIIKPMVRSNMCLNAHPIGCAKEVENQIAYVKALRRLSAEQREKVRSFIAQLSNFRK